MALNIFQTPDQTLMLMQKSWVSQINPVLANLLVQGSLLQNISLVANTPQTFSHYLGKQMTGWEVADKNANANVWRTQPLNSQTLTLESSANVTLSIWVF